MTQALTSLARLTLRQLRQIASDLGVSLYSRKSKDELLEAIGTIEPVDGNTELGAIEAELPPANRPASAQTTVVFLPRDPQWAYVFWEIAASDRQVALRAGATQLALRLSDVTGLNGDAIHPHALQEVSVEAHATEWYLPMPLSDRDYRVELGYRGGNGDWISLAHSSVARVPALHPSEQILDQFVPFSLETSSSTSGNSFTSLPTPAEAADTNLHERLYQSATVRWKNYGRGSEAFHEHERGSIPGDHGLSASGAGIWASGRSTSGIGGVAPRKRAFWLVADAELIVYGSTDPSARLLIGDEEVPLSSDGTFRVQVPFRDGQQLYPIEAIAADGEQKRNITLQFERITPEDNSNTSSQAISEWF